MEVRITTVPVFERRLKHLAKRYASLRKDYALLLQNLRENPTMGTSLGNRLHKVRMAITSKGKGKSGGARVITYALNLAADNTYEVRLLDIYDKSERSTMTDKELEALVKDCGL